MVWVNAFCDNYDAIPMSTGCSQVPGDDQRRRGGGTEAGLLSRRRLPRLQPICPTHRVGMDERPLRRTREKVRWI